MNLHIWNFEKSMIFKVQKKYLHFKGKNIAIKVSLFIVNSQGLNYEEVISVFDSHRVIVHTDWSLLFVLKHRDTWLSMITSKRSKNKVNVLYKTCRACLS